MRRIEGGGVTEVIPAPTRLTTAEMATDPVNRSYGVDPGGHIIASDFNGCGCTELPV
jgi:hypothetical protein